MPVVRAGWNAVGAIAKPSSLTMLANATLSGRHPNAFGDCPGLAVTKPCGLAAMAWQVVPPGMPPGWRTRRSGVGSMPAARASRADESASPDDRIVDASRTREIVRKGCTESVLRREMPAHEIARHHARGYVPRSGH